MSLATLSQTSLTLVRKISSAFSLVSAIIPASLLGLNRQSSKKRTAKKVVTPS